MTPNLLSLPRREFLRAGVVATAGVELAIRGGVAADLRPLDIPSHFQPSSVKVLVFDVFGTVVDWRTSVTQEVESLAKRKGLTIEATRFADAWRAGYGPAMDRVRTGQLPWTTLDELHRIMLDRVLSDFGVRGLSEAETDALNRAWHRLRPWPDAVAGQC